MLSDALRYPLDGESWVRTILIGGLLTVLSVLVLPWFFLQGYYVRVLRGVTNGDPDLPQFDDWVELLIDGVKLFVLNVFVVIVLLAVQIAVAVLLGAGSLLAGDPSGVDPGAASGRLGLLGIVVFAVAVLLLSYVVPAMFANFAREDSLVAAFDLSTVLSGALTREYLIAWVLVIAVSLVLGTIASVLTLLLVGIFGLFYVQIATYYLFGRGFAAGLDADGAEY
ncbi:DUF4013 domain-containing protein [Halobellus ruber]|uniref:DUF4013 domain-containing protein n=1 Tax=Halobellus ruber TaxID=2761102 RepID=A0A7J9SJS7_9EURY|nr:DUF4013 domain-containing protein [Halobellus ruber]MBB6646286.1 DUF4013 domain-containing protein [Halobellus ruber]